MGIKFNIETHKKVLTFRDVKDNQLFINYKGSLCQKICRNSYCTIASCFGDLLSFYHETVCSDEIVRHIYVDINSVSFDND